MENKYLEDLKNSLNLIIELEKYIKQDYILYHYLKASLNDVKSRLRGCIDTNKKIKNKKKLPLILTINFN